MGIYIFIAPPFFDAARSMGESVFITAHWKRRIRGGEVRVKRLFKSFRISGSPASDFTVSEFQFSAFSSRPPQFIQPGNTMFGTALTSYPLCHGRLHK